MCSNVHIRLLTSQKVSNWQEGSAKTQVCPSAYRDYWAWKKLPPLFMFIATTIKRVTPISNLTFFPCACFPTCRRSAFFTWASHLSFYSSLFLFCLLLSLFSPSSVKALLSWCRSPTSIRPTRSTSTLSMGSTPTRKSTRLTLICSR